MANSRFSSLACVCMVALVLSAGCRSFPLPKPPVEDVAIERERRRAVAVEQFEQNRNFAEFHAAKVARERGDLRNSQAGLESLLRRYPQHRDARLLLADVQFERGRSQEAFTQLQTALEDFPNDPEVHRAMGTLSIAMNQPEDAWAYFERAKILAHESIASDKASTGVGQAYAEASLRSVVQTAHAADDTAGKPTASTDPNRSTPTAHDVRAENNGRNTGAFGPAAATLLREGEAALAQGASERSLALFRQAAALEPNNPHIPTTAAVAALRQDRPELSVTLAQESLAAFPSCTPLRRTLGAAYYRQGDYGSSQLVLQQALSLDKADALAYLLLGCTHLKLGQTEAADACFADARRLDPSLATHPPDAVPDSLQ
ncbi:MAG TPA: tetratricopeptide repeat protein [Thermoguttaceae bacterium]|nr:tetratricopeptide repeat protein [Thermoguttaceae bacterium]